MHQWLLLTQSSMYQNQLHVHVLAPPNEREWIFLAVWIWCGRQKLHRINYAKLDSLIMLTWYRISEGLYYRLLSMAKKNNIFSSKFQSILLMTIIINITFISLWCCRLYDLAVVLSLQHLGFGLIRSHIKHTHRLAALG